MNKDDYPKQCEKSNEKLLKLLSSTELPDLSSFTSEDIWKEEEDAISPVDGSKTRRIPKDK